MQEDLCTIIEDQLARSHKSDLAGCTTDVSNALIQFRDIAGILAADPGVFFDNLFRNENLSKFCYPCDIIELRTILTDETIYGSGNLAFLPVNFATHYFSSYSAFLLLNDIDSEIDLGALKVVNTNTFSIKDKLLSVLVNGNRGRDALKKAYRIVKECDAEVRVEPINQVPGICMPQANTASVKVAEAVPYRVNIESLGIKGADINACSATEAVQKALNERWQQLYGSKVNRSEKFLVKNWMNSPFWNDIVRQSDTEFNLMKMAQNLKQQPEIKVTPKERDIFDFLRAAKQSMGFPVKMRVAGGWVRDKLLNIGSDDIDIAISHMSGPQFIGLIEQYARANNIEGIGTADYSVALDKGAEETNPQLQVGGMSIFGQKVEFVPLRQELKREEEASGSRNWAAMAGKFEPTNDVNRDAERRDLTINAMYYNIDDKRLEDPTGQGLIDLQNMYLRTPLDPVITFIDDPLRMLRTLRFLARYQGLGAELDPKTEAAFSDPNVRKSFSSLVKRERIGGELWGKVEKKEDGQAVFKPGILGQDNPRNALEIMFNSELDQLVFEHPSTAALAPMQNFDQKVDRHAHDLQEHTLQVVNNYAESANKRGLDPRRKANGLFSALTHDFGKRDLSKRTPHPKNPQGMDPNDKKYNYQYVGHEEGSASISEDVGKHLAIPPEDRYYINAMNAQHMRLHTLAESEKVQDKAIRKYLRKMTKALENQPGNIEAFLEDVAELSYADVKATHKDPLVNKADQAREMALVQRSLQEAEVQQEKPVPSLMSGADIMKMFPTLNPQMGFIPEVNTIVAEWLDESPDITEEQVKQKIMKDRVDSRNPESLTIHDDIVRRYTPILDYKEVQRMLKDPSTGQIPKNYRFRMTDYSKIHQSIIDQSTQPGFNADVARQIALQEKQRIIDEQASASQEQMKKEHTGSIYPENMQRYSMKKPSYNLSKIHKDSQNPMGQDSGGYEGFHAQEGGQEIREQHERSKPMPAISPYYKGQLVKMRRRGLSFEQVHGKVDNIGEDRIIIQWDNEKESTTYPLDLSLLAYKIQKVN